MENSLNSQTDSRPETKQKIFWIIGAALVVIALVAFLIIRSSSVTPIREQAEEYAKMAEDAMSGGETETAFSEQKLISADVSAPGSKEDWKTRTERKYSASDKELLNTYVYDAQGNIVQEPVNSVYHVYVRNADGKVIRQDEYSKETDEISNTIVYSYNGDGNEVDKVTYFYGEEDKLPYIKRWAKTEYDENGEMTKCVVSGKGGVESTTTNTVKYNKDGKLTKRVSKYFASKDNQSTTTEDFKYDKNGNLTEEAFSMSQKFYVISYKQSHKTVYEYDESGKVIREKYFDDGKLQNSKDWVYNDSGKLDHKNVCDPTDGHVTKVIQYDENGEVVEEDNSEKEYDDQDRMIRRIVREDGSSQEKERFEYFYDEFGRMSRMDHYTKESGETELVLNDYTEYEYQY